MLKHFVTIIRPGIIVSEYDTKEINEWDINKVIEIIKGLKYKPFAFYFTTKEQKEGDWGIKEISRSGTYYVNGIIKTLQEVKDENCSRNDNLIWNMEHNNYPKIVRACGATMPFEEGDQIINI